MEYIKIGNVKIAKTAALAPRASVANSPYRVLCCEFGAGYTVSEMVSVKGLCYGDHKTEKLCAIGLGLGNEDSGARNQEPNSSLLNPKSSPAPTAIQLFGSEPEFIRRAVEIISQYNPDIIDINMGCPVPKVVNIGCGCAMMKDIKNAAAVTLAAVKTSKVPITVKIRKGWDENSVNAMDFAKAMEASGAAAITVHGRTRDQFYSGSADWNIIAKVKESISIPVIGNGDVTDLKSCLAMYDTAGCDLVMIGRGSYGNPFVFKEIEAYFNGKAYTQPGIREKMNVMLRHIRMILDYSDKSEALAIREARKHAAWYMVGLYGAAKFRAKCYSLSSYQEAQLLAEDFIKLQEEHSCI